MELDSIYFYVRDADRTQAFFIEQMGLQSLDNVPILPHHQVDLDSTCVHWVGNSQLLFAIASPLDASSPVAEYLRSHPSGVKDVSFRVLDLTEIRRKVVRLGVEVLAASSEQDEFQWLRVAGWGDVDHTIVQAKPDAIASTEIDLHESIVGIDHIVLNVAAGELDLAANWYRDVFDFQVEQTFDIQTQTSGLASKALVSACGKIRFNINEPSSSNSQIQEFLDLNHGAGIQHIALQTQDIWTTIDRMQQQKLAFLPIPPTYYTNLQSRAAAQQPRLTDREWQQLEQLQILMDWVTSTPEQILLQIFTQPIFESPTFFFEVIERRNRATGFGQGNFQALFEAIEEYNTAILSS